MARHDHADSARAVVALSAERARGDLNGVTSLMQFPSMGPQGTKTL